jgi:predicted ATP-grasp superfamily ATP-dependent carboligase
MSDQTVLIAAYSGRALAEAARRAGYLPLVADLFCDADTRHNAGRALRVEGGLVTGFSPLKLCSALAELRRSSVGAVLGIVYGAGFETEPAMLTDIARMAPVIGNTAGAVATAKNPHRLSAACANHAIPHPEIRDEPPPHRKAGWLLKRTGSAGGTGTVPWDSRSHKSSRTDGDYWQRAVPGEMVSVLFLADGSRAQIVGFSRQWVSPSLSAPFRFGGAVTCEPPSGIAAALAACAERITAEFGLRGLNSIDFIVSGNDWWLIEVNPRPGATLDLFDTPAFPLFKAHVEAVAGRLTDDPPAPVCRALAISYAGRATRIPMRFAWPEFAADRPAPGTKLRAGDPICTVFAAGKAARVARNAALGRAAALTQTLLPAKSSQATGKPHVLH